MHIVSSKQQAIQPKHVIQWLKWVIGKSKTDIAREAGVSRPTGDRAIHLVSQWVQSDAVIEEIRKSTYVLVPDWFEAAQDLIRDRDSAFCVAFGRGMGLFRNEDQIDASLGAVSDADLKSMLNRLVGCTASGSSENPAGDGPAPEAGEE